MRRVRISQTFRDQLDELIAQGFPKFGERVVTEKRNLVLDLINGHLARHPRRPRDSQHGMCVYTVSKTPFVLIYDYDDHELRVLFIFYGSDDLRRLDPSTVEWDS